MAIRLEALAKRTGLTLRAARPQDFTAIREIAIASFTVPQWLTECEENLAHYNSCWPRETPFGPVAVAVAASATGSLAGYLYFQLRTGGDLYLKELAAIPPHPADFTPRAGTFLLGYALELAADLAWPGRVTLNVMALQRHTVRPSTSQRGWRDPADYYSKFGFSHDPGSSSYTSTGTERRPRDTWMVAEIATALENVVGYLASTGNVGIRDQDRGSLAGVNANC